MHIHAPISQLEKYIISGIVDAPIVIVIISSSQNPGVITTIIPDLCYEFLYIYPANVNQHILYSRFNFEKLHLAIHVCLQLFKNVIFFLNICLAVLGGLSCSTWALHCSAQASLVVASRLHLWRSRSVAPWHVGF